MTYIIIESTLNYNYDAINMNIITYIKNIKLIIIQNMTFSESQYIYTVLTKISTVT